MKWKRFLLLIRRRDRRLVVDTKTKDGMMGDPSSVRQSKRKRRKKTLLREDHPG